MLTLELAKVPYTQNQPCYVGQDDDYIWQHASNPFIILLHERKYP
jgi:hypothetical protein